MAATGRATQVIAESLTQAGGIRMTQVIAESLAQSGQTRVTKVVLESPTLPGPLARSTTCLCSVLRLRTLRRCLANHGHVPRVSFGTATAGEA